MNNGLELLADEHDPEMRQRCMDLLAESAKAAADRLKFFRLAFGAAGGFGSEVDPNDAKLVIEPMVTSSGRTVLDWAVPAQMMPKRAVKILLNLVLLANDALIRGGTLSVGAEAHAGELEIVIGVSGPKILMEPTIRDALTGQLAPAALDPRTAAAWMAHTLTVQNGGMLQLAEPDAENLVIGALIRTEG